MDLHWAGGDINRMQTLARELVSLQPDVILTNSTAPALALRRETRTIPIVFVAIDPVASGIVARLDRPSGNVTSFANNEPSLSGKWIELLSEIAPGLKRAAIMFNPDTFYASTFLPSLETAARSLKVEPIIAHIHTDAEIETAIIALGHEPGGGLVVVPDGFMTAHRAPIILAAARNNVPAVFWQSDFAREGGLLSYGPDSEDIWRRHLLCGSHPARREARRSPGAVSDQVRDGREPQDRHGARPCHTPIDTAARGRGDRMIRRREFITVIGGAAFWALAVRAQQGDRVRRIGVLSLYDENEPVMKRRLSAFTQALANLGWTDGRNVRMDLRWGGADINRIRALAKELVGLQPDIILINGATATAAVQRETRTIPIIFVNSVDPVASGIVARQFCLKA
jgi:putative ABC transport system substrate-binding protein